MLMLEVRKVFLVAVALTLALGALPRQTAYASDGCNTTISPTIVSPGTEVLLQFDIQNTGSDAALWVSVQRPTVSYSVNGITQSGWTDATDDNGTVLTAGSIAPGGSYSFQLAMFTGPMEEAAAAWSVQLASGADGSGAYACGGSLETAIGTPPEPPTPNGESNIGLTHIAPTTATIAWTSDVPSTSYVYYGLTDSYGKVATTPGSDTAHSVTLTGLSPSTIYHYMVAGSDEAGNNLFSADNTFITPAPPPPPLQPVIIINNPPASPGSPPAASTTPVIPKVPGDVTAPTVTLDTSLSRPFPAAPVLRGSATDNGALAQIQYSTDGGRNWVAVTGVTGIGGTKATFSFTPLIQDDGNYSVVVGAIDSNGNESKTAPATLVIDRLPPQVGPLVVSYGPEVLTPNPDGAMELLAGSSYRFTASTVGGATSVTVEAQPQEQVDPVTASFSLIQSPDSGLWSGSLSFKIGGIYQLVAKSVDGAGNKTTRPLTTVAVTPAGRILAAATDRPLAGAKLTLSYFEPSSRTWQLWDGAPYAQTNPQTVKPDGSYSLAVPAGKYYLSVQAPGYRTFTSTSFEVTRPLALASTIALEPAPRVALGPIQFHLPTLSLSARPLPEPDQKPVARVKSLAGQQLPDFNLQTTAGGKQRNLDLEGRPTDLVVLATWSPSSQSQLPALADVQTNRDVNVTPLFSQEHATLVSTYVATAGYRVTGLIDPDGLLVPSLQIGSLPQHIFIDRSGRIKKVMVGVLSKDQILATLGGL